MRTPHSIIKRPLLTEKSTRLRETGGHDAAFGEGEEYAQKIAFEVAATPTRSRSGAPSRSCSTCR